MFDTLFQAICKVGIFMICAQAIIHFRPQEVYEKYMRLLVSVMILIQLLLPIGSIFLGDGLAESARRLGAFWEEVEQELEQAAEDAAAADRMLESMTLEEVRERLEEQEAAEQGEAAVEEMGEGQGKTTEGQQGKTGVRQWEAAEEEMGEGQGKIGEGKGGREDGVEIKVGDISVRIE